jgi:ankyrin repeat protein
MGDAGGVTAFLPYVSVGRGEWCDELCAVLRKAAEPERLDLEVRMANGRTAFLRACTEGHVECMELLAQVGCDTSVTDDSSANALMCTAFSGEAAVVRAALDAGWCELEARDTDGDRG